MQYRIAFPLLIQSWREAWGRPDLPFYFCQFANFLQHDTKPSNSNWAELRDAQTSALQLPDTGVTVLIDIGEENNLHPRDKRDAGEWLASITLARDYDEKIAYSRPMYRTSKAEGDHIRLWFDHTTGGLVARQFPAAYLPTTRGQAEPKPLVLPLPSSQLRGFAISGSNGAFQ